MERRSQILLRAGTLDASRRSPPDGNVLAATMTLVLLIAIGAAVIRCITFGRASKTSKLALPVSLLERWPRLRSFIEIVQTELR